MYRKFSIFIIPLLISSCSGIVYDYNYKLSLQLDTPDGIKTCSSVVNVAQTTDSTTDHRLIVGAHGSAMFCDLGSNARPLVVLLTYTHGVNRDVYSAEDPLSRISGIRSSFTGGRNDGLAALIKMHGVFEIRPKELPDLVAFGNVDDPTTVERVNPDNLEATLGQGVKWNRITLEIVRDATTSGIERFLPWITKLQGPLDGALLHNRNTLSNTLAKSDFLRK